MRKMLCLLGAVFCVSAFRWQEYRAGWRKWRCWFQPWRQ